MLSGGLRAEGAGCELLALPLLPVLQIPLGLGLLVLFVPLEKIFDRYLSATSPSDVSVGDEETSLAALFLEHFVHQFLVSSREVSLYLGVVSLKLAIRCEGESPTQRLVVQGLARVLLGRQQVDLLLRT